MHERMRLQRKKQQSADQIQLPQSAVAATLLARERSSDPMALPAVEPHFAHHFGSIPIFAADSRSAHIQRQADDDHDAEPPIVTDEQPTLTGKFSTTDLEAESPGMTHNKTEEVPETSEDDALLAAAQQPVVASPHEQDSDTNAEIEALPIISGVGKPEEVIAFGTVPGLKLHGITTAAYSKSYTVKDVVTEAASGCKKCKAGDCIHVTGTLEVTYQVVTTVKLPPIPASPKLSECQTEAIQNFIDNVLTPHEEEHVSAFKQYEGTTETPFDMVLCRDKLAPTIQAMFRKEEKAREEGANAASAALDPFEREIEGLDCTDE